MIGKYYLSIAICCIAVVTVSGGLGGPGSWGKGKKCRLQFKFPSPCIDLKPPDDVQTAIKKCWSEAIDTDFKCQKIEGYMKETFTKRKRKPKSPADFIFISSFHWLVYFTDDISPNLCPLIKAETREKIKSSFRSCFLKETNIEMGEMINVRQVISQIEKYTGSVNNMTTVIGIADLCSSKSMNQEDFSKCVMSNLLGACMRDPYYKNPFMQHKGGYKPGQNGTRPGSGPPYGGRPGRGGNKGGYGGKPMDKGRRPGPPHKGCTGGGRPKKKHCEPCFELEASDELRNSWKSCLDSTKPADFYTKFMRCIKWEPAEDKPEKAMWTQLFTPRFKLGTSNIFFNKKSQDAHLECMYQKFGLGTTTGVNPQGFKDLILNQLEGDDKTKDDVIETIDACSYTTEDVQITSEDFTTCTAEKLQNQCDEE